MEPRKESLLANLGAGLQIGLMTRLSHLIVIQVVFVFAALVLIIFSPSGDVATDLAASIDRAGFSSVARNAAATVAACNPDSLADAPDASGLERALTDEPHLLAAAVYRFSDSRPEHVYGYCRDASSDVLPPWDEALTPRLALLDSIPDGTRPWPVFPLHLTEDHTVFGAPVTFADGSRGVLVAALEHDLVLSNRGALGYALLLLFLCAALFALLTVYLIHRRFTQPFRRMIRRFEKTSDGELYYLTENGGDEELARLAAVFNKLSSNLLDRHQRLNEYDEKLRDTSCSLEESQLLLAAVIENTPVGIITTSPSGRILLFNRKAAEIFATSEAAAIGQSIDDLFLSDIRERARAHEGEADEHGLEMIGRRCDRTQFAASVVTSTLRDEQGACIGYVYIVRDISERKDYQQMLLRLDRYYTKGEMAGDIAHEINNFLAVLMGNLELVPVILRKGDRERLDRKLELMHGTVEKIARLTDGMLDGGRDDFRYDRCDVNQIVQIVVSFLKPQNKLDNTEVITDLAPEMPLAEMDPNHIQQALVNLVYNAAEAVLARDSGRTIHIGTALVRAGETPMLELTVRDNGPGVPPDKLPLLFKRRFTTRPHGHGIGLIACRRIVEAHGGRIGYAFDGGAVFTVAIPIERPQDRPRANATPDPAARPATANF